MTPNPDFKVMMLFDAEYPRNGTRYSVTMEYKQGLILRHPYSGVSFQMTLCDSAKYSMKQIIAQPVCNS